MGCCSTRASRCSGPRCWTTPTPCTPRWRARCCCATTGSRSTPTASGIWRRRRCSTGRWRRRCGWRRCWATDPRSCLAVAARIPLALTVLALAFAVEAFARRAFRSARAGLYAALILLSSFGVFLFTPHPVARRDGVPVAHAGDALLLADGTAVTKSSVILSAAKVPHSSEAPQNLGALLRLRRLLRARRADQGTDRRRLPYRDCRDLPAADARSGAAQFAASSSCIRSRRRWSFSSSPRRGMCWPRGRIRRDGLPGGLAFAGGHWHVPLPTDGNVHGWAWFYFVNEQVLRYLNLRVPARLRHRAPLALLGPVPHLADAVVGICVQGCCKRSL